jgi:osmoprotectant transport system substrate-binding protein
VLPRSTFCGSMQKGVAKAILLTRAFTLRRPLDWRAKGEATSGGIMWVARVLIFVVLLCLGMGSGFYYGHVQGSRIVKGVLQVSAARSALQYFGVVRPDLDMTQLEPSRFVRQTKANKKVLVFVHGVTGTASETWARDARAYWPDIAKEDGRLSEYDIFVVSYYSPQQTNAPNIFQLSDLLNKDLEAHKIYPTETLPSQYEEVVFVCHSMANLVVRTSMVIKALPETSSTQIPLIISIASPSEGSSLADLAKDTLPNPQFKDMASIEANSFLQFLNAVWERRAFDTEIACAYELRNHPSFRGRVVEEKSATAVCSRPDPKPIDEDHERIVKPNDSTHPVHTWLVEEVRRKTGQKGWELPRWSNNEVVVGGKDYLESNIHAAMIKVMLKSHLPHLSVTAQYGMGHASRLFTALKDREIDIYPEYDGSLLREYLRIGLDNPTHTTTPLDAVGVNKELKKTPQTWNMVFFPDFGFENPYVLVMLRSKARELRLINRAGVVTLSDLATVSEKDLILLGDQEFPFRKEWQELQKAYKLKFKDYSIGRHSDIYLPLKASKGESPGLVGVGFGTDFALNRDDSDFITIEDDKRIFPYYRPAALAHRLVLRKFKTEGSTKGIEEVLSQLADVVEDTREMSALLQEAGVLVTHRTGLTEQEKTDLEGVAAAFLKKKGRIP